jgi:hypothetical protein
MEVRTPVFGTRSITAPLHPRPMIPQKIVFSRKAWDSKAGRKPNPIIDGHFVPLPIPKNNHRGGNVPLNHIYWPLRPPISLDILLGWQDGDFHPDPWLYPGMLKKQVGDWLPAQGHTGGSPSHQHLLNQKITEGDVMLFYGWFRNAKFEQGRLTFEKQAPDLHVIFGYLQIGKIFETNDFQELKRRLPGLCSHPHLKNTKGADVLYVAKRFLEIPGLPARAIPGGGLFPQFNSRLVLTDRKGGNTKRSVWRLPGWASSNPQVLPEMTYLKKWNREYPDITTRNRGQGQEFVLKPTAEIRRWLVSLFKLLIIPHRSFRPACSVAHRHIARTVSQIRR